MRDFDSIRQKEMGSIENRVRHIYNRGYDDGLKDGKESLIDTYDAGRDDAWEYARKIVCEVHHGGLLQSDLEEIFGTRFTTNIFRDNTASEAIAKVKAWEEKQKTQYKWKRIGIDIYECPACGMNVRTSDICAYKYCHGCGKKMREGEE